MSIPIAEQQENLEKLLDIIANTLINYALPSDVLLNQKFVINGQIQTINTNPDDADILDIVSGQSGLLALFQKDVKANEEDLKNLITLNPNTDNEQIISELQNYANNANLDYEDLILINTSVQGDLTTISITLKDDNNYSVGEDITNLIVAEGNPLNLGQFIPIQKQQSVVDIDKANEFLDTNIFELLPSGDTRQQRIIKFFNELNTLLPPDLPNFDLTGGVDGGPDTVVDRDIDGNWTGATQFSQDNSISYSQDNPEDSNIEEEEAFIHRLKNTANTTNQSITIEDIYNTIRPYLLDILEPPIDAQDNREVYANTSSGYLKFRNPNQGIIIRNINQQFVDGLNPETLDYLQTGFTITMWVRFLDKVSEGTLFNFGNPLRDDDTAFGFKLETYIVNKDDPISHSQHDNFGDLVDANAYLNNNLGIFNNTDSERFVRLVVNDDGVLRESHTGNPSLTKIITNDIPTIGGTSSKDYRLLSNQLIPQDFSEWYFICATFNHLIEEDDSLTDLFSEYRNNHEFWMNRINPITNLPSINSGYGNKCKVEIISRTDLLRARGFKV